MLAEQVQISELLKQGFSIEDIGVSLGLTVEAVTAVAMLDKGVSQALESVGVSRVSESFNHALDTTLDRIKQLRYAENESVALKACTYIVDEQLGLKKPKKEPVTVNLNLMINEQIAKVLEMHRKVVSKVIDVDSKLVSG